MRFSLRLCPFAPLRETLLGCCRRPPPRAGGVNHGRCLWEDGFLSVERRRSWVSCRAGVSGAGGSPWPRRSPMRRSMRFRLPRRRLCWRLSLTIRGNDLASALPGATVRAAPGGADHEAGTRSPLATARSGDFTSPPFEGSNRWRDKPAATLWCPPRGRRVLTCRSALRPRGAAAPRGDGPFGLQGLRRAHGQHHAILRLSAHHPLVRLRGAGQREFLDHRSHAREDGEV